VNEALQNLNVLRALLALTLATTSPMTTKTTTKTKTPAATATATATAAVRRAGPAGSLLIVESNHAIPLVYVAVAARGGYASDPRHQDGLTNLAAELARRGAGQRTRAQLDDALDQLGATLEVETDADAVRFVGHVLARNLDPFLAILGDIVVRPQLDPAELSRTRREIAAQINESRNDDQSLCARFFVRNLYGDHPYGRSADGTHASLEALGIDEVAAHYRRQFVGKNLIFAAAGDVDAADLAARLGRAFNGLRPGSSEAGVEKGPDKSPSKPAEKDLTLRTPVPPSGWRIQLVDKPDRQQTQIMFGHAGPPATDPDFVALQVALTAFGGHGMTSILMDEVRTKRGLVYGAYMTLSERRGAGAVAGWVFSSNDKVVATLKLVLKLYVRFMDKGLDPAQVAVFQSFLAGSYASDMDAPEPRLEARLAAELAGLPPDFVDTFAARVRAVTAKEVNAAIAKYVHARDLAITMVSTAAVMKKLLVEAKIKESAIDVVDFEKE
jgi:zinc protease